MTFDPIGSPLDQPQSPSLTRLQKARGWGRGLGQVLLLPAAPVIWVFKLVRGKTDAGQLSFSAYPRFIAALPLVAAGFALPLLEMAGVPSPVLGWIYYVLLGLVGLAFGFDVNRTAFWAVLSTIAIIVLGAGWWGSAHHTQVFRDFLKGLQQFKVDYTRGGPLFVAALWGVVLVGMAAWQRFNDLWLLNQDTLEHRRQYVSDTEIQRAGKTVVEEYPCLIKRLFCLGWGNIVIKDSAGLSVHQRIDGVLFCGARAARIRQAWAVTNTNVAAVGAVSAENDQALAAAQRAQ
jgi:hypothetical protein